MAEKQQLIKIVRELQSGNKNMAAVLYETYYRDLHYYILKRVNDPEKAEALTQDTFIEIFDTVGTLKSADEFGEWSRKIADRRCDEYKRVRRELLLGKVGTAAVDSVAEERKEIHADQEASERADLPVHEVIDSLSEEQRAVVLASYVGERKEEDDKVTVPVTGIRTVFSTIEPFFRKLIVGIVATVILASIRDVGVDWRHKGTDVTIEENRTFVDTENVEESGALEETEIHEGSNSIEKTETSEESNSIEELETSEESGSIEATEIPGENSLSSEFTTEGNSSGIVIVPIKPAETTRSTEPIKATEAIEVTEPTEATGTTETTEITEMIEPTESTETVEPETENESDQGSVGLEYSLIGSVYAVSGRGTCTDKEIVIPATYNGLPVREIAPGAFEYSDIEKVEISEGIRRIETSAFGNCSSLMEVKLPDSLTHIEGYAFGDCRSLETINIPKSVVKIGDSAFILCTSLKTIHIPAGVHEIGWGAFCRCYSLEKITVDSGNPTYYSVNNCVIKTEAKEIVFGCKNSILPTNGSVLTIGGHAFCSCSDWEEVEIPEGVAKIGESAFNGCSLERIILPSSLTEIGYCSFAGSGNYSLNEIHFSGTTAQWNAIVKGDQWDDLSGSYMIYCTDGSSEKHVITESEFLQIVSRGTYCEVVGIGSCTDTEIVIPKEYYGIPVTKIGDGAFNGCNQLVGVTLQEGITEIGINAFDGCTGLQSVTLPESLRRIGNGAFNCCESLYEFTIPEGVTAIGIGTFSCCYNLTAVNIPESVTQIGGYAFSSCYALKRIHLPSGLESLGVASFAVCSGLEEITVSEGSQFYYSVDNCLIEKDSKMLVLGCKNSVIPADGSVTAIGNFAFEGAYLAQITIPDGITNIGIGAFESCALANSLEISETVAHIENNAFSGCTGLFEIKVASENPAYYSVDNCLIERESKTLIKAGAYSEIPMNEGLTAIGAYAFYGYSSREALIIPDGVTKIGESAFSQSKIKSITIPASVTDIDTFAFHSCENLEAIYYLGSMEEWYAITKKSLWDDYTGEYTVYCSK